MKKKSGKEELPRWKRRVNDFNEAKFSRIEKFVKRAVPWLVF